MKFVERREIYEEGIFDFGFTETKERKLSFSLSFFCCVSKYSSNPEENCDIRYEIDGENINANKGFLFLFLNAIYHFNDNVQK